MICHLIVIHVTYHPPEGGHRALLREIPRVQLRTLKFLLCIMAPAHLCYIEVDVHKEMKPETSAVNGQ